MKQISILLLFIAKHIPLKQWAFDDSHSPEYQKFKVDKLPKIFIPETVDYHLLLAYYQYRYGESVKPISIGLKTLFHKPSYALVVLLLISTYIKIMAPRGNISAKSAMNAFMKPTSIIVL